MIAHFNSIKVRLKQGVVLSVVCHTDIFQFHKGTIKTLFAWLVHHRFLNFNSIKVRLKQTYNQVYNGLSLYFNSIKVRLKRFRPD